MGDDPGEPPAVTPGRVGAPLRIVGARFVLPVERVFAIVDAVVAIAMTIILLEDAFTISGEEALEFGLAPLLDGLEAMVERKSGKSRKPRTSPKRQTRKPRGSQG
jgi:hypothetical protein